MIEAKGHYAEMMRSDWRQDRLAEDWVDQAGRQVKASGGRPIEWYFHELEAYILAQKAFDNEYELKSIRVFFFPHPSGVPNPNSRMKWPQLR
ncbi:hypothetical protein [Methylocella silvestris]|uniref:hypothetical protein n=1 Tax=Methylocella silvestris TaxID=199596 RepID=UPI00059DD50E|nr:hypothetical protein [Methylocella silvestris]